MKRYEVRCHEWGDDDDYHWCYCNTKEEAEKTIRDFYEKDPNRKNNPDNVNIYEHLYYIEVPENATEKSNNNKSETMETKILNIGRGRTIRMPVNYQHFILDYSSNPENNGWEREDVIYILECVKNGNLEALNMDSYLMNNIGTFFEDGICVKPNINAAVFWYEQAVENGNDLARSNLADILRKGTQGYPKDLNRAFQLYKECGLPYAHYRVGEFYEHGWGVSKDLEAAKAYYRQAYQERHALAEKKLKEWNFLEC